MINSVVIVSGIQQSDSVIHISLVIKGRNVRYCSVICVSGLNKILMAKIFLDSLQCGPTNDTKHSVIKITLACKANLF